MDSRRDFIKKAALLSGGVGFANMLPASVQRALSIDPALGTTFLDAEHIVILMQENRSFDHCFGSLQGVRGFNDPRAITLPDSKPVWLQTNAKGETYLPFRLNIKDTKATHMGSLPHSWTDQVDAGHEGRHDRWLLAKASGHKEYAPMPLTLGYYNRKDLPFYYGLADAFTVCDQNFCSSLTGTTPNRLYLWTGKIRDEKKDDGYAHVRNEDVDYNAQVNWSSFPERLEENGISWKIYQNEISVGVGLEEEEDAWLANFTDNPLEWFAQYHVKFLPAYMAYLPTKINLLNQRVPAIEQQLNAANITGEEKDKLTRKLKATKDALQQAIDDREKYTPENYAKLSPVEKALHEKAFTTNIEDPDYHHLETLSYKDGSVDRTMKVPKGDILHQFRADVRRKELPAVSWLVAPANYSDHPGAPWYGAWYVSEVMDILTQDPDVWKKTIFILAYDENDGYFDHVPPFTAPDPRRPETGTVSKGIDTTNEMVTLAQELKKRSRDHVRESPIGLGYRVPLIIASPWSRGGAICSQVFDHTSIIRFMEKFLSHKSGKKIEETNISSWRRTICGDLTAAFQPYNGEKIKLPTFLNKDEFIEGVHKAQYKKIPSGYRRLSNEEITGTSLHPFSALLPKQEKGIRHSCALPYELYADGRLGKDRKSFVVYLEAANKWFGEKASGSPFSLYGLGKYAQKDQEPQAMRPRSYAVKAGDILEDQLDISGFENSLYQFRIHGPNGFFREFSGDAGDPVLDTRCAYEGMNNGKLTGNIELKLSNNSASSYKIEIKDNAYKTGSSLHSIPPGGVKRVIVPAKKNFGWYDFSVRVAGRGRFEKRFAGRVETGRNGFSDPLMGLVVRS